MRVIAAAAALGLLSASALAADVTVINDKAFFPEGPVMVDGKLLYVEYGANRATLWDGKSNIEFWHQDGCGPSAIVPFGDNYAVTCYDSGQMAVVSKAGKTVASYAKDDAGKPLVGPNDGTPDGKGGIYFTASGPVEPSSVDGRVFHMKADGTIHEVADDAQQANGVTLSPDGQRLYVNESVAGRVNSFKVEADGSLSDRHMFLVLGQLAGEAPNANPDAVKFGPDGNLYIGEASAGRIVKVDLKGQVLHRFEVPSAAAPNFTFSADAKTLYIMAVDDMSAAPYPGKVYAMPNE
jgi:sugar lactone lactonase YvrE